MERSIEVLAIILFGALGLSHILQPQAWVKFFILLRTKGEPGAFVDGFLNLPVGGVIIGFHNTCDPFTKPVWRAKNGTTKDHVSD